MTSTLDSSLEDNALSTRQIADHLSRHPDFFNDFPELTRTLRIPHDHGVAISLAEKQIQLLREQNRQYKQKLMELVDIGRDNDTLHYNLHRLTMALMRADSLMPAIDALFQQLQENFQVSAVALRLAGLPLDFADQRVLGYDRREPELAAFDKFFSAIRPRCGFFNEAQLAYLFQDRAGHMQSTALIPLGEQAELGLLALGSEDPHSYHPGHETHFLSNLGDLVSCALGCHLPGHVS